MNVRVKTVSKGAPDIAQGRRSTGIVPATRPQESVETRSSRSEKIVSGIAISVLVAGFATGLLGASAARGIHPEPRVAHIKHDADWRDR
jgi:hypothetical protein